MLIMLGIRAAQCHAGSWQAGTCQTQIYPLSGRICLMCIKYMYWGGSSAADRCQREVTEGRKGW